MLLNSEKYSKISIFSDDYSLIGADNINMRPILQSLAHSTDKGKIIAIRINNSQKLSGAGTPLLRKYLLAVMASADPCATKEEDCEGCEGCHVHTLNKAVVKLPKDEFRSLGFVDLCGDLNVDEGELKTNVEKLIYSGKKVVLEQS